MFVVPVVPVQGDCVSQNTYYAESSCPTSPRLTLIPCDYCDLLLTSSVFASNPVMVATQPVLLCAPAHTALFTQVWRLGWLLPSGWPGLLPHGRRLFQRSLAGVHVCRRPDMCALQHVLVRISDEGWEAGAPDMLSVLDQDAW